MKPAVSLRTDLALTRLKALLGARAARFDADLLDTCPSTNTLLLERAAAGAPSGAVLWALEQTAGRGRRGRSWQALPGESLTFSLLWRFAPHTRLAGLSLVAGLALIEALDRLGLTGCQLKWPNDVWHAGRKLAGVLVELQQAGPRVGAVIGIGLNLRTPERGRVGEQAAVGLEALSSSPPDDVTVLAALLDTLADHLDRFAASGFAPFRADFERRHALHGLAVRLSDDAGEHWGTCLGVDEEGALLLGVGDSVQRILGGDVSLRGAS